MEEATRQFMSKMEKAMERVRLALDLAKVPCFASDVHHEYYDKFALAECIVNACMASQLNTLSLLGMDSGTVEKLRGWSKTSAVSLTFRSEERCTFARQESREVESPSKSVTGFADRLMNAFVSKTVTKVTEYFWKCEVSYQLMAVRGAGAQVGDRLALLQRQCHFELKTPSKSAPRPEVVMPACEVEVDISTLLKQLADSGSLAPCFQIDRAHKKCCTPRRNFDVHQILDFLQQLASWAHQVAAYIGCLLACVPSGSSPSLENFDASLAVMPLMFQDLGSAASVLQDGEAEKQEDKKRQFAGCVPTATIEDVVSASTSAKLLTAADLNILLGVELQSLLQRRHELQEHFPGDASAPGSAEALFAVTLRHSASVCKQCNEAIHFIEQMLREQLVTAIGKEVTPADFAEYMRFHHRKLFVHPYLPRPFCYAVRRSTNHSPEGWLSIEEEVVGPGGDSNIPLPIVTSAAEGEQPHLMRFPLGASTQICFGGERYLHGWLSHKFSGESGTKLSLVARARQFSSFIVLVGRISSATTFEPTYAAVVQNRDELTIPLDLSTIPTPKEFKDAVESLSPEQKSFAKAFRAMQLESTLFGVVVIQIKPQLEKVLNLMPDSLTKEIRLTQQLMRLFMQFQIPSDLLSYDVLDDASGIDVARANASSRVNVVRGHVNAMEQMVQETQKEELAEAQLLRAYSDESIDAPSYCSSDVYGADLLQVDRCDSFDGCEDMNDEEMECEDMECEKMECEALCLDDALVLAAAAPPAAAPAPAAASAVPVAPAASADAAAPSAAPVVDQAANQSQLLRDSVFASGRDYTRVPKEMDRQFLRLDVDAAVRPTIIKPSETWSKQVQKGLLAQPNTILLEAEEQEQEKNAAFDLLDALTKSGALVIDCACLHVVVAATHRFDKAVIETVIQDDINPIDKVERSALIMASTVHDKPVSALVQPAQLAHLKDVSPQLCDY